eukprot:Pompholyxophrys_punicea_v1_NODE_538_length_1725_cov_2.307784.p2 type:complete len:100 gc:universal NODE_538_length_1725_cov_2.307784:393-94(-)
MIVHDCACLSKNLPDYSKYVRKLVPRVNMRLQALASDFVRFLALAGDFLRFEAIFCAFFLIKKFFFIASKRLLAILIAFFGRSKSPKSDEIAICALASA